MKQERQIHFFYFSFLLSFIFLFFVFSSVLYISFYHHDTFKYSFGGFDKSCQSMVGYNFLFEVSRPISAFFDCLDYKVANTLDRMSLIRLVCLPLIAAAMMMTQCVLRRENFSFWSSFFVVAAIFCLPAIQTALIMGAMTLPFSILMAILSQYFFSKCVTCGSEKKGMILTYFIFSVVFIGASLFTYPSLTGFFLLPTLSLVLFTSLARWRQTRIIAALDLLFYGFSSFIYYLIARSHQLTIYHGKLPDWISYRVEYKFSIKRKIGGLIEHFPALWNLYSGSIQIIFVGIVLLAGSIFAFKKCKQPSSILWQAIIVAIVIFLMGSLVYLVSPPLVAYVPHQRPFSRITFVSEAMALLILIWCVKNSIFSFTSKIQIFTFATGLFAMIGAFFANYITTQSALNDSFELNYITSDLVHALKNKTTIQRIHVVLSSQPNFNGIEPREDIFNRNSTFYFGEITHIINASLLRIVPRDSYVLKDCIFPTIKESQAYLKKEQHCIASAAPNSIIVTYSEPGKPIYSTPHMLLINLDSLTFAKDYHSSWAPLYTSRQ